MTRRNLFQAIFGAIAAAFLPHKAVKEKEKSRCPTTDTITWPFSPAFSNEEVDIYIWNDGQPVWTLKLS
jgi:hypothetical protein